MKRGFASVIFGSDQEAEKAMDTVQGRSWRERDSGADLQIQEEFYQCYSDQSLRCTRRVEAKPMVR